MRFMTMVKMRPDVGPPPAALMEAMGKSMEEQFRTGKMVGAGALLPGSTRIRLTGGEVIVSDGPFTEATEVIGGYAITEVESEAEAIAMAREVIQLHQDFWPGWEGETEVHRLADGAPETS